MNTDRAIAILGIIIGLPAFFALFFSNEHRLEGALVSVLVVFVVVGTWWYRRQQAKPQFTSLELRKTYIIQTTDGSLASAQRIEKMRANFHGITEWWNRALMFDGTVTNILIDGEPPSSIVDVVGTLEVCKRFPRPLEKDEVITISMTYELHDSFTKSSESVVHTNSTDVPELVIVVELPRPCITAEVRRTYSGDHGKLEAPPSVSTNHRIIEAKIKKPHMGASYHVDWTW